MTPDIIASRALNAARIAHLPTYVALRSVLDSHGDRDRIEWLANVVSNIARTRTDWRYYNFPIFKEFDTSGDPEYRDCTIGSPTTLLAEAHVLSRLSKDDAFSVPECAYSYHWPQQDRSSRNFQYFFDGYTARDRKIAELLSNEPGNVAVVADIRRFYPSVEWNILQAKFEKRVERLGNHDLKGEALGFLHGVRKNSGRGIPIGPDFSHLLGQIALEDVDASLHSKFGSRYLRYVDDLIVVCPATEAMLASAAIASTVRKSGFEAHEGKNDVVGSQVWLTDCPSTQERDGEVTFDSLVRDITVYLMLKPKAFDSLREVFREEGFLLPFERFRTNSKYGPFRRFVKYRHVSGILDIARLYFWTEQDFLARAKSLREELKSSLLATLDRPAPAHGMARRWHVQKCKFFINRLLYLLPLSRYGELQSLIPEGAEFQEHRVLVEALVSYEVRYIAHLPGRLVAFFCQLISSHGVPRNVTLQRLQNRAVAESASAFALSFGWQFASEEIEGMYPGSRTLLQACSTGVPDQSQIEPHSYLDEIELLLRGSSIEKRMGYVQTRADEDELIGLEGLLLGERNDFS